MIADIPYVASNAELLRIAGFNRTATAYPNDVTLNELIESQIEQHPSRVAVICDHDHTFGMSSLTYAQLNEKVNQLAHRLRAEGIRPGHVVAIMVERSFAMPIGVLAIVKAGAAYLPLPPDNPPDRIEFMLQDAQAAALLVHRKTAGKVTFRGPVFNLDDLSVYRGSTANPGLRNAPQDLAYVIYTSGSTGRPKGVMIEHRAVINRLHWMQRAYPIGESDVILQKTPFYFDVSVWELFWWALEGAQLALLQVGAESNPFAIVETIRKFQVSVLHFVPSMLSVFLEYLAGSSDLTIVELASVRQIFASGEALSPGHVRRFNTIWGANTGARLTNLYGPTEATVDVTYFDCPTHNEFGIVPIGRPIDNTRLYIIRDGQQVGIGYTGELCIAGAGLARGYLNNTALTQEKFIDNPVKAGERIYRTGDVARWLPDGNIEYLGREDHQVKLRGLRIELGEIENTIREHPGIVDCAVTVRKYSEGIVLIVAYLVCSDDVEIEQLKLALKARLPDYMIPNRYEKIAEMPLTPSGKANRQLLAELQTPRSGSAGDCARGTDTYVAPRNDLELCMAAACERVLGIERIGITDNIFELGAHSLTAIKLVAEIKKTADVEINLGEVFRSPTIAAWALSLGVNARQNASIVVPLQSHGAGVPIFCIYGIDVYRQFAQSLGENQPVLCIYVGEERAIIDEALAGEFPSVSMGLLVDAYCDAIVRVRPRGPYRLAGLSFGGILAVAIACKMRERGDQVDLVFLFDTLLPEGRRRLWVNWCSKQVVKLARSGRKKAFGSLYMKLRAKILNHAVMDQEFTPRQRALFFEASKSWKAPGSMLDFAVILFRASDHDSWQQNFKFAEDYGWRRYLGNRLSVVPVTGGHLSIIQSPNVADLGRHARRFLRSDPA